MIIELIYGTLLKQNGLKGLRDDVYQYYFETVKERIEWVNYSDVYSWCLNKENMHSQETFFIDERSLPPDMKRTWRKYFFWAKNSKFNSLTENCLVATYQHGSVWVTDTVEMFIKNNSFTHIKNFWLEKETI